MQSSTVGQGSAQKAVDGSTSSFYNTNTCTMTEAERNPWFYVNLLEPVLVQLVRIDFGSSCCSNNRPAVITVRVGNNRPDLGVNPVCNKFTGFLEEGRPLFLPCARPMPGAFVSITLESAGNPLSICETFVYTDHALSIEQCPSFRDQPLGSTSTYNGKCYIFYNNQPLNFDSARRFCEVRGGSLVDETSPALQGFLSWELYRRHRNDPNGQYWLGALRDPKTPANWKWINGKDVTISFWNLPANKDNCSRFDGTKGWLWSDTNYLECGFPASITNGQYIMSNNTRSYLSSVNYSCKEGYVLVGRGLLTCDVDERWNGPPPRCEPVICPNPPVIVNSVVRISANNTIFGAVAEYTCDEGYELMGESRIVCNVAGFWDGEPGYCRDARPASTSSTSTTTRGTTSTTTTTRKTTTTAQPSRTTQTWPVVDRSQPPSRGPQLSLIPISSTPAPQSPYLNTRRTNVYSTSSNSPTTTTTTTTTTTRRPTPKSRTTRPTIYKTQDNEINDSLLRPNTKAATARLNMGGIIALAVFGGFVFLAAVITIVVIIVRRLKNSHNALDAQTISTFDSSGDNSGFYHKYASAWSQLQSNGIHSASYKPGLARVDPNFDHHNHQRLNRGTINEGFREANEITLNADVAALYSRPDKRYKRPDPDGQSHWQHNRKY
ncbi:unnamed protein product [Medioppia subpectinata]|uniref:Uncharacterized protein n=1 Tax=Medioppia subpectinata TaxID=1979941 RepID=A0A7R9KDS4_9ACAR|nr:unnamed protein product [Medioppia subpectinata]CAG2101422.1 unnamed protein product [Medioppia subpectinata]